MTIENKMLIRQQRVAVQNYPLMNPKIVVSNLYKYLELEQETAEKIQIPLYIHVPFCINICNFCIYNRELLSKNYDLLDQYIDALIKEIRLYGETSYVKSSAIGAIFFGGGTPTCIPADGFEKILRTCRQYLPLADKVEITVECNVINANYEKLLILKDLGVNRISTGVQTLNEQYRKLMGLQTTAKHVSEWIDQVKRIGFDVTSIDMLYGLPGQSIEEWNYDLNEALKLEVDHLSIYELCVLAGSKLYSNLTKKGLPILIDQEKSIQMYMEADRILKENGYLHHIVPEYNRIGKKAKFWELCYKGYGDNLSLGTSSYGFMNGVNYQNISNIKNYIKEVGEGQLPIQLVSNKATEIQLRERAIVLGFRRRYVEKESFYKKFGCSIRAVFPNVIDKLLALKLVVEDEKYYSLTTLGEYLQGDISIMFMESTFKNVSASKKKLALGNHIVPEVF